MAYAPFSGKNARVRIGGANGTIVTAMEWTVDVKTDELDISNFEGGGFGQWTTGLLDCDVSLELQWDANADPTASPLNLYPGVALVNVFIYVDKVNLPANFWQFPILIVTSATNNAQVRGVVKYSVKGKSSGVFTSA